MGVLRWAGYIFVAILILCVVITLGALVSFVGAFAGTIAMGAVVVLAVAAGIKEYVETPSDDRDT